MSHRTDKDLSVVPYEMDLFAPRTADNLQRVSFLSHLLLWTGEPGVYLEYFRLVISKIHGILAGAGIGDQLPTIYGKRHQYEGTVGFFREFSVLELHDSLHT